MLKTYKMLYKHAQEKKVNWIIYREQAGADFLLG